VPAGSRASSSAETNEAKKGISLPLEKALSQVTRRKDEDAHFVRKTQRLLDWMESQTQEYRQS
jgi:hypothetical protein